MIGRQAGWDLCWRQVDNRLASARLWVGAMSLEMTLLAVGKGDQSAFRGLFDSYGKSAMAIAMRILRDRQNAEDAVQEAFVRIWRMAVRFDPKQGAARAWLAIVVRNASLDRARAVRPLLSIDAVPPDILIAQPVDPPDNRLRQCLSQLPADHARAITVMYMFGLSHSELAEQLGQPLGTVKSWIRRGTMQLQECMLVNKGAENDVEHRDMGAIDA